MNIPKAIEVLVGIKNGKRSANGWGTYGIKAIELGIEALKRVDANRHSAWPANLDTLPSEAEDREA